MPIDFFPHKRPQTERRRERKRRYYFIRERILQMKLKTFQCFHEQTILLIFYPNILFS